MMFVGGSPLTDPATAAESAPCCAQCAADGHAIGQHVADDSRQWLNDVLTGVTLLGVLWTLFERLDAGRGAR